MTILTELDFKPFDLNNTTWVKYKSKKVKWIAIFTLSGKILLKDENNKLILTTKSKEEFKDFIIKEERDTRLDDLLGD